MHAPVPRWVVIGILIAAVCLRVEAQGAFPPGLILAAKVQGKVTKTVDGEVADVATESTLRGAAKLTTGPNSSVVLAFSNGTTLKLGENSELAVDEFVQESFAGTVAVNKISEEPSESKTKLRLLRGELVADVKKLRRKGDGFTVETVAGMITTRGGVFRIVFRAISKTQASFRATTARGVVEYASTSGATRSPIPPGQEIALTIDLTPDGQGQILITQPQPHPGPTSPSTLQQLINSAGEMAETWVKGPPK